MATRRPTKTREQYVGQLRYQIKDAKEALRHAVDMHNWRNVIKYAKQLETFEDKLARAEGARPRSHRIQETMHRERIRRSHPETREQERARLRRIGYSVSSDRRRRRR